jgi:hypothetical protein
MAPDLPHRVSLNTILKIDAITHFWSNSGSSRGGDSMAKPVDLVALDPETRRLAERGTREAFGVSLDELIDDLHIAGEAFDEKDLETLLLAAELAERAGLPEPVMPPDSSPNPLPVDIASLTPDMLRLADRGARELFRWSLDRLVDNLKIAGRCWIRRILTRS